jgi:glyoxylase I family protein
MRSRPARTCFALTCTEDRVDLELMFLGLEHTAIASPCPEKLAKWYVDHLGFRINFEYDGNYFVRAENGSMLEIIPSEGARAEQKMRDEGIRHLAIQVTDFDAAHAALKAQNVNFIGQPYVNQGNRLVFFTDCDGNFVHLIQREKPLP